MIGFRFIEDEVRRVLLDDSDWFLKYSALRDLVEPNLMTASMDHLTQIIDSDTNPMVKAYAIWLAFLSNIDQVHRVNLVNASFENRNVFVKKVGIYLWQLYGLDGVRTTSLPQYLRDKFITSEVRTDIEECHRILSSLFRTPLNPDFPLESVFGNLDEVTPLFKAAWATREQGVNTFVRNVYTITARLLNGYMKSQDSSYEEILDLQSIRETYFLDNVLVDGTRILESYWHDVNSGTRLSNGKQTPILSNIIPIYVHYLGLLHKSYLGKEMRKDIFISYSHKDEEWRERMKVHLTPFFRNTDITVWDDKHIKPGQGPDQEIKAALDRAKVAILLVSANFMASNYIDKNELPEIFYAARNEGLIIIWIAVGPTKAWKKSLLKNFQCAHEDPDTPLMSRSEAESETVLAEIADYIDDLLKA